MLRRGRVCILCKEHCVPAFISLAGIPKWCWQKILCCKSDRLITPLRPCQKSSHSRQAWPIPPQTSHAIYAGRVFLLRHIFSSCFQVSTMSLPDSVILMHVKFCFLNDRSHSNLPDETEEVKLKTCVLWMFESRLCNWRAEESAFLELPKTKNRWHEGREESRWWVHDGVSVGEEGQKI